MGYSFRSLDWTTVVVVDYAFAAVKPHRVHRRKEKITSPTENIIQPPEIAHEEKNEISTVRVPYENHLPPKLVRNYAERVVGNGTS